MRRWSLRSAVLVLATILISFSCERSPRPDSPMGPPSSADLLGLPGLGLGGDAGNPDDEKQVDPREESRPLVFIEENGPSTQQFGTAVLGVVGGVLSVGGHSVDVPPGAVLEPTLFTMLTPSTPVIDVELNALVPDGLSGLIRELAVFLQPVTLELSYAHARGAIDPDHLVIVRLLDDGRYEVLPTQVDKLGKVIRAELDHFSKYAMASN